MKNYSIQLEQQLKEIDELIRISNRNLSKLKDVPDIRVNVGKSNGCDQYYFVGDDKSNCPKLKYSKVSDRKLVKRIVQRDYEVAINKKLLDMRKRLDKFLRAYDLDDIQKEFMKLPYAKRKLITPLVESDEQYIERWLLEHEGGQNTYPEEGQFITAKGERVRSKSEKIIADMFDKYQVPYKNEPMLKLQDLGIVYPDFIVLNVRQRKTYYWEHLGKISEPGYAVKNLNRILSYEKSGYLQGDNLIITMESMERPLDMRIVEKKIKQYLL